MPEQVRHQMILAFTTPDGVERWTCLECERELNIISWVPLKREIVEEGDLSVIHWGGKGGLRINVIVEQGE